MTRFQIFLAAALATLIAGCQSPTQTATSSPDSAGATRPAGRAVPLAEQAFTVVTSTNQLDPQWLQAPTEFFRLGPGDLIEVEMLGESASRAPALVGPDGKVYYGLLPGIFVWGKTLAETKSEFDGQLKRYFREEPQVAITLRSVTSQRIWILGSVQAPGVYGLATPTTLLEAISLAGGTGAGAAGGAAAGADEADLHNSFVMRNGSPLGVDFHRLLRRGDLSQNIYLQPDDFVYLKPGGGQYVYVLGAVGRAGLIGFVDQMSVASAIAGSGGTIPYAQASNIAVLRGSLTSPRIAEVNYKGIIKGTTPDVLLEPGDIVYVPFTPFRKLGELADNLVRQFVSTVALNEGSRAVNRGATPVGVSVGVGGIGVGR